MPKIVQKPENQAVAKTISLEVWEWAEIEALAAKWRVSRSRAIRQIWMEWDAKQVQAPLMGTITGGREDAAVWEAIKAEFLKEKTVYPPPTEAKCRTTTTKL